MTSQEKLVLFVQAKNDYIKELIPDCSESYAVDADIVDLARWPNSVADSVWKAIVDWKPHLLALGTTTCPWCLLSKGCDNCMYAKRHKNCLRDNSSFGIINVTFKQHGTEQEELAEFYNELITKINHIR
jgi:hypothetical protein